jgi:Ubiquitin-2 like Rad60 SUMO-like
MPPDSNHTETINNMTNETQPSPVGVDTDAAPVPNGNAGTQYSGEGKEDGVIMESPRNSTAVDSDGPDLPSPLLPTEENNNIQITTTSVSGMIVQTSNSKRQTSATSSNQTSHNNRIPYKYDPEKITLRFLFANRDGLTVTVTCKPSDTVGEVKGALISVWPKGNAVVYTSKVNDLHEIAYQLFLFSVPIYVDMPNCDDGDDLRLVCMGKGFLSPDAKTLEDCQVPVFKTHPTPVNVSVKPSSQPAPGPATEHLKKKAAPAPTTRPTSSSVVETGQGCCIIS